MTAPEDSDAYLSVMESHLIEAVEWLRLAVETMGVIAIAVGAAIATAQFFYTILVRRSADFARIRFTMARYLAMALEFQLGADILSTAVAPSWEAIGKLAAIAVIRTGLNFFLAREMKEQEEIIEKLRARPPLPADKELP
ncbi:MAG: DUF1622 domain-containing protein [Pseudomonadota bacterium]|nr:DUF1622 domain-containing protein [Pseudomonadota bacterium]